MMGFKWAFWPVIWFGREWTSDTKLRIFANCNHEQSWAIHLRTHSKLTIIGIYDFTWSQVLVHTYIPALSMPSRKHLIELPSNPAPITLTVCAVEMLGSNDGWTEVILVHDEPSPPHTPHASLILPLLGTLSHPMHELLSPPQIPGRWENKKNWWWRLFTLYDWLRAVGILTDENECSWNIFVHPAEDDNLWHKGTCARVGKDHVHSYSACEWAIVYFRFVENYSQSNKDVPWIYGHVLIEQYNLPVMSLILAIEHQWRISVLDEIKVYVRSTPSLSLEWFPTNMVIWLPLKCVFNSPQASFQKSVRFPVNPPLQLPQESTFAPPKQFLLQSSKGDTSLEGLLGGGLVHLPQESLRAVPLQTLLQSFPRFKLFPVVPWTQTKTRIILVNLKYRW